MARKYRILLTRKSLSSLTGTAESDRPRVRSFLHFLMDGRWEESPTGFGPVHTWKQTGERRFVFSCRVMNGVFAIWEVLWTIDLAVCLKKSEYGVEEAPHEFSLHILLYSFGEFPGDPDTIMHLMNRHFELEGPIDSSCLDFYERQMRDEVKYNEELYILAPSRIDGVLRGEQRGLPLHLTVEQVDILSTHRVLRGPILVSGEAGSGKTSVITLWLLMNQLENIQPQLFVTFSERLVERTKADFEQMLPPTYATHGVQFMTYRDLLQEIVKTGGVASRNPEKRMTFERFMREYAHKVPEIVDPVLLWDEIRSVIKGGSIDLLRRLIDYDTYEQLEQERGRTKTPLGMKAFYYRQAQAYQNYLDENGMWDDIDLAFDCLGCVDKVPQYERLACDEVQDLAPVEIHVLIGLVKDHNIDRIFYTGDTAQVINPSGFNWRKLKGYLGRISRRHDIRDAWSLGRNFRSTKEIVSLVNEIIRIRENILVDSSGKTIQKSEISSGIKPMILEQSPIEVLKREVTSPQQRLVLVKTREKKDEVRKLLGEAENRVTVLTVEESKGLEWDGVLLWDYFIPRHEVVGKDDWEAIFIPEKRNALPQQIIQGKKNPYGLAYEFNLLHVGLTRARNVLAIYDEDKNRTIVSLGETVIDKTMRVDLEVFSKQWKTASPTPEELYDLATDLLEKDLEQAHRFFRLAAREYEKRRKFEDAGKCLAKALEFSLAAKCYDTAGNETMREKMLACDCRSSEDWKGAANHWETYAKLCGDSGDWRGAYEGYGSASSAYVKVTNSTGNEQARTKLLLEAARMSELRSNSISHQKDTRYQVLRAEILTEAAEYSKRAKSYENTRRLLEAAIAIAQDVVKSEAAVTIGGVIPDAWVAECYSRMAENEKRTGNLSDATKLAMAVAGSYDSAATKTESASDKETYLDELNRWRGKAIEWYIEDGQTDAALEAQNGLVEFWRKRNDDLRLVKAWSEYVELLGNVGRNEEFVDQASAIVEHLRGIGQRSSAYKLLRKQVKSCEEREDHYCLSSLLGILARCYVEDGEHSQAGRRLDELGNLRLKLGMGRDAISSYLEAGSNHMRDRMHKAAIDSFTRGYEIAQAEMSPSSVGWFCFVEVTLASLVPAGLEIQAMSWTGRSVDHFSQEYERSISRLKDHIATLGGMLGNLGAVHVSEESEGGKKSERNKMNKVRIHRGWTWLCLALLYHRGVKDGIAPLGHRENVLEALTNSEEDFREAGEQSMISRVKGILRRAKRGGNQIL